MRIVYVGMIAVLGFFATCTSRAPKPAVITLYGRYIENQSLSSEIQRIMEEEDIPGLSIAIITHNRVAYHAAFGVSNAETREPVDSQSMFEGASLSKPIFAYYVMKLVEDGMIDLDTPLYQYLPHPGIAPDSEEEYRSITARMVLSHQTGFPNHAYGQPIHLAFTPGTDFMYSGEAYQYLAAVVASIQGVELNEEINTLFRREVTLPLGMPHTTFVWDDFLAEHTVYGHDTDGNPVRAVPGTTGWSGDEFRAYSSIHSEALEYSRFIIAMLTGEGLSDAYYHEMLEEHTRFSEDNPLRQQVGQTGWGLGFAQKTTDDWTMHLHTGNNHDFQSYAMFVPEKEYGIVAFTNSGNMVPFLERISELLGPQF